MRTIILFLFSFVSIAVFSQSLAEKEKTKIWQDFRENYPNPYQTIAFAQFNDKSQLYLISEPPPYIQLSDITELFEGFDYSVEVKTWKIGYDGWVKDVLVCVHYIPPVYKLLLVKQLNELLFANSYKPMCKELPVVQPRRVFIQNNNVDYKISAMELNKWFVEGNMRFTEVEAQNNQYSFNELFNTPKAGVYASNDYTFVVWGIPYNNSTGFSRENISKFAIESDIILGAISNNRTLIVIGRGRQCSYAEFPPLRIETIEMLAGTTDERFSQSLNITELITGKTETGADWCPAYVSDELENDEFGHILTLTDIFLKDWIGRGKLSYPEYYYPKPKYYPFEAGQLKARSIRYNWNTEDYIYSTYINGNQFITLHNTGCLNVSLFDNDEIEEKDFATDINQKANDYFAKIQNADIIRAVQYTALYKIFKANNVQYSNYSKLYTKDKSTLLLKDTREILSKLRNLSNSEITNISRKIANDYYNQYLYQDLQQLKEKKREDWEKDLEKAARAATPQGKTYEEFIKSPEYEAKRAENLKRFETQLQIWYNQSKEQTISEKENKTYDEIIALRNKLAEVDYSDFEKLCKYVSYPNGNYTSDYSRIRYLSQEITKLYWSIWIYADYFGISMEKVKNDYVKSLANDNGKWMKTPKVVVTKNEYGRVQVAENKYINVGAAVGGHTLSIPVKNKQADYTEKPRTVDVTVTRKNTLRTTPDEYNYARGTGNTPSSNIIHYLPYGSNSGSEATENAIAHYSAYNNDVKPAPQQQNNISTANNLNDATIARYVAHYDDVLKPTPIQEKIVSQGNTEKTDNTNTPRKTESTNLANTTNKGLLSIEPFKWGQIEHKGKQVVNIESTGNALEDATFYSSMGAAEAKKKDNADVAAYYAGKAVDALSGTIGKVPIDPKLSNELEKLLTKQISTQVRIPSVERKFSEKAEKAKEVLDKGKNLLNEDTKQKLERFADRADRFLQETNDIKKAAEMNKDNPEKYNETVKKLEEKNNRMELQAKEIKEQAIEEINNCKTCPANEKEELVKLLNIF